MKPQHRCTIYLTRLLAAAFALLSALAVTAQAQEFPNKPIKIVVPYPPGGASDTVSRVIAERLGSALSESVVIENKPGANGIIASSYVAKAPADGHTLLMGNVGPNAINPSIYKLPYDAQKDFSPIILTNSVPLMLVVRSDSGINSMADLIAAAKSKPNAMFYSTGGTGTAGHFAMELFMMKAGIKMQRVSYKGDGLALQDMLGGRIDAMFTTGASGLPHVHSGRLKAIAVGASKQVDTVPGVKTVSEQGMPGFEAVSWGGILAPANTPEPVVRKLNAEINKVLEIPEVRVALAKTGSETVGGTPAAFKEYIASEMKKWAEVAKLANIKGE